MKIRTNWIARSTQAKPFNLAPIDLPEWRNEDFTKGCYITQDSGIGLTCTGISTVQSPGAWNGS